jgi:hypoxanthine phosphoribosyltransferase
VQFEYEPVEFALEWDESGRESLGFRPDFYLPELDLFIELTTLRQRLVTKKNRKVRTLRELHPEIQIEVLYRRDYEAMIAGGEITVIASFLRSKVARSA